jgi:large subunit ribosomal protein L31
MKETAAHPHYRPAKITCACGTIYDTFSTRGDFAVVICS